MIEDPSRQPDEANPLVAPPSDELVDEAGRESFPASDPPATWSGEDLGRSASRA